MIFFQKVRKFITSWTNALNESALREIFLPSSDNVNDYVRQGFGCTLHSKIVELKRMKLQKHCWEENQNFKEIKTKIVDRKSRLIPRKIKETMKEAFWNMASLFTLALSYLSILQLYILLMKFKQTLHFCVGKNYSLISLISWIIVRYIGCF